MSTILVCTDGSQYSSSIYQYAAWVAEKTGSAITVLHVIDREEHRPAADFTGNLGFDASAELMEELVNLDEEHARVARLRGKAILEDAKRQLAECGATEVTAIQRHGSLVETIDEFERSADVVLIGKRGEHADLSKGHLGSNLERVVRSAEIPILVSSRAFQPVEKFLIAFDGGSSAQKAVDFAVASPLLKGSTAHLLSVGKQGSRVAVEFEKASGKLKAAGFTVQADLLSGDADELIAQEVEARGIDLLLIGAYGHSLIRRLIIGSTTTSLVRTCKVPVLLFR
jgi:nucleotide-binding universal stress UspA family protein